MAGHVVAGDALTVAIVAPVRNRRAGVVRDCMLELVVRVQRVCEALNRSRGLERQVLRAKRRTLGYGGEVGEVGLAVIVGVHGPVERVTAVRCAILDLEETLGLIGSCGCGGSDGDDSAESGLGALAKVWNPCAV